MLIYNRETGRVTEEPERPSREQETVWIRLHQASPEEVSRVLGWYRCHPLVIEDCIKLNQRPKLDRYKDHILLTFFAIAPKSLSPVEMGIVIGSHFVITVTHKEIPFFAEIEAELLQTGDRMAQPGQILHRILDRCVDDYTDITDHIEDKVDKMERNLFRNPYIRISRDVFHLKRTIHGLRRIVAEEKTILGTISHQNFPYMTQDSEVYFIDIYDHISRVIDSLDVFRESLSGLLELQMGMKSDRMNEIMKTLTIISSIFLPLTFIVGLYGMNFKNIPELNWDFGYLYVWIVMLVVAVGMWLIFRWKRWL
ncbi:magnesium/cobalt transporter CorA [Paenibacillus hamazuiensis]|uniref:magnesium/cobalt transporter CorA n=1 Tax=Paenibacillus hamazuiensis TaxID=2936508 RepID=UPI00200CFBB3|nr:magnesium/cobalt transporter CorA [Paenibacillus hamazuiensis]